MGGGQAGVKMPGLARDRTVQDLGEGLRIPERADSMKMRKEHETICGVRPKSTSRERAQRTSRPLALCVRVYSTESMSGSRPAERHNARACTPESCRDGGSHLSTSQQEPARTSTTGKASGAVGTVWLGLEPSFRRAKSDGTDGSRVARLYVGLTGFTKKLGCLTGRCPTLPLPFWH